MSAERFPTPSDETLTALQREAINAVAGSRGAFGGPFVPLLHSPRLMRAIARVGEYLRFESDLPSSIFEMTVLVTARAWNQPFEWNHHAPLAIKAGLDPACIADLAAQRRPTNLDPTHLAAHDVVVELIGTHQLDDETFATAASAFDEAALIEIIATAGYYSALAMILNAGRISDETGSDQLPASIERSW